MARIITGERGIGKVLVEDGFKYQFNRQSQSTMHWRCITNLPSNVYFLLTMIAFSCTLYAQANGAEHRSGHKPRARVLIPPGYLHPGKGMH
jgi:hypothetical protein